jgi:hypothetical protein
MPWSTQTQSARMAIIYITLGALIDVWTALYYWLIYQPNPDGSHDSRLFWIAGFFFSGLTLLVIGILVGRIGRAAGKAEVAPATTQPVPSAPAAPAVPMQSLPVDIRPQQAVSVPLQNVAPTA